MQLQAMCKSLTIFCFHFCLILTVKGQVSASQNICSNEINYELLNLHIKYIEKTQFSQTYFLEAETTFEKLPFERSDKKKKYSYSCDSLLKWENSFIKSKWAVVKAKDSIKMVDYSCFISLPKFNLHRTECLIISSIHHGEWSWFRASYYYKKINGVWRLNKTSLYGIS